jgi:2-polyprenyl-3-methyl-5-hydroxy-6-metoxy-1,4-benzoquinol methylase
MAASPSGALAAGELAQLHFARIARLRAAAPRAAFRFGADGNPNMIEVALAVLPGGAIGSVVWRGAVVLCELLARRRALVAGRRVLELGAGVGLVALVAARLGAASVLATDAPGAASASAQTPRGTMRASTSRVPWGCWEGRSRGWHGRDAPCRGRRPG